MKLFNLKQFIQLTLAGIINAIGITMFLSPVNLYDSGISGTSMFFALITPEYLSLSFFLLILNIPLFLYGYKRQGLQFTVCAVYTVFIYSLFAWIINDILPIDVTTMSPFAQDDLLLCSVFGGLISGVGSGLAIKAGGAMDGVEVMAVIFAKRLGITVGSFVMIYNVVLYLVCGLVFQSWVLPLYSILAYMIALKAVDYIVEGFDRSKAAMIITVKPNEVSKALMESFGSGITKIDAMGGYSDTKRTVIYFVLNRFQIGRMKNIVHDNDPSAFITITEVADVFKANHN